MVLSKRDGALIDRRFPGHVFIEGFGAKVQLRDSEFSDDLRSTNQLANQYRKIRLHVSLIVYSASTGFGLFLLMTRAFRMEGGPTKDPTNFGKRKPRRKLLVGS